jgi:hypothetical protein
MRWGLILSEFDFEVIFKPGRANTNADCLSRITVYLITNSVEPYWDRAYIKCQQETDPNLGELINLGQ